MISHLPSVQPDQLQFERRELHDPETGRRLIQLTSGEGFCYPLYYFIPTMTPDGGTLVFHRWAGEEIQMYALEVQSGQARRLTWGKTPDAAWRPWMQSQATGVRDQLSALNCVTRELIYFDCQEIRAVHIDTLKDRLVAEIPPDRTASGLSGISPDGRHLTYGHIDRGFLERPWNTIPEKMKARGSVLELLDLATGATRPLLCINTWITHANFVNDDRIVFCHPATEDGMLITDLKGGWYAHVRTQDGPNLSGPRPIEQTSHYQATELGIAYEMRTKLGLCDPYSFGCQEYTIGEYPVTHIGRDPLARQWFFDSRRIDPVTGGHTGPRCICYMPELRFGQENRPTLLMSGSQTYGVGQHSHLHPVLMPDRQHILFTGADDRSQTNHLFLMDISDLPDTRRETRGEDAKR